MRLDTHAETKRRPPLENAGIHRMPNLLHELQVKWLPHLRIELEEHAVTAPLLAYSMTDVEASEISGPS